MVLALVFLLPLAYFGPSTPVVLPDMKYSHRTYPPTLRPVHPFHVPLFLGRNFWFVPTPTGGRLGVGHPSPSVYSQAGCAAQHTLVGRRNRCCEYVHVHHPIFHIQYDCSPLLCPHPSVQFRNENGQKNVHERQGDGRDRALGNLSAGEKTPTSFANEVRRLAIFRSLRERRPASMILGGTSPWCRSV